MTKLKALVAFALPLFMISGTYRHDTPIEKYLTLANEARFSCVGQIFSLENTEWVSTGSFVVIDSLHLMSAAHCFIGEEYKDTVVTIHSRTFKTQVVLRKYIKPESEFRFQVRNHFLKTKNIVIHPSYLKNGSCDIAILTLEKPLSFVQSIFLNKSLDELNDTVIGVGYGISGPASKPELVAPYNVKLAGMNIVDSIGGVMLKGLGTMLYADFDCPDIRQGCNKIGDSIPLELEYSTGAGDSGGPLFSVKGNEVKLIGVASYSGQSAQNIIENGYYCQLMGWTRVSAFYDWISAQCGVH